MAKMKRAAGVVAIGGVMLAAGGCNTTGMQLVGAFVEGMARGASAGYTYKPNTSISANSRSSSTGGRTGASSSYSWGVTGDGQVYSRTESTYRWRNGQESRSVYGIAPNGRAYSHYEYRSR